MKDLKIKSRLYNVETINVETKQISNFTMTAEELKQLDKSVKILTKTPFDIIITPDEELLAKIKVLINDEQYTVKPIVHRNRNKEVEADET